MAIYMVIYWNAILHSIERRYIQLLYKRPENLNWQIVLEAVLVTSGKFQFVFIVDRAFANPFGSFVLVNAPLNAYLLMCELYGQLQGIIRLFAYIILAYQFVCIVGFALCNSLHGQSHI